MSLASNIDFFTTRTRKYHTLTLKLFSTLHKLKIQVNEDDHKAWYLVNAKIWSFAEKHGTLPQNLFSGDDEHKPFSPKAGN